MKRTSALSSLCQIGIASASLLGFSVPIAFAAHSVAPLGGSLTPIDLVNTLVGGTGITVTPGSVVYTGADIASGTFSGATPSTGLPFVGGILLTSGSVENSVGPNTFNDATLDNGLPGNAFLETVTGIDQTYDATLLSFKFTSSLNLFSFRYVFGSEEYNEWAPSAYNDVFAFILTDADGNSVDLAVLPNGDPVSVNNVRLEGNPEYYYNNSLIDPVSSSFFDIEYDGLVGRNPGFPLSAVGNVIPGEEYTITLAIADTGDHILDSGVFLKQGSFIAGPPEPDDDGGDDDNEPVPEAGSFIAAGLLAIVAMIKLMDKAHRE